jgi:hypothetical protein
MRSVWKKLPEPTAKEMGWTRRLRRMRLYADEDIEDIVELLRMEGVNITSARELGHRGKPDEFHAGLALKQRQFLLTKNDKHFWSDRLLPLHQTFGIVSSMRT